jgi:hypothetical protein
VDREAAARCPGCKRYFCRECVTEHEGRVTCAECLALAAASKVDTIRFRTVRSSVYAIAGVLLAWIVFYYVGAYLSRMPASFHGPGGLGE